MKKSLIVIMGLFSPNLLVADDVLYCTSELNSGFAYEDNSFREKTFENTRFTVKVSGDFESIRSDDWNYSCRKSDLNTVYLCLDTHDIGVFFKFNKENGRFLAGNITGYGYLSHSSTKKGSPDTDHIRAGKCEDF
jgi:hypothetical protein